MKISPYIKHNPNSKKCKCDECNLWGNSWVTYSDEFSQVGNNQLFWFESKQKDINYSPKRYNRKKRGENFPKQTMHRKSI